MIINSAKSREYVNTLNTAKPMNDFERNCGLSHDIFLKWNTSAQKQTIKEDPLKTSG